MRGRIKVDRIDGAAAKEDGVLKRFWTALRTSLALCALAASNTGHASEPGIGSGPMTGAYFMRDTLVPRADDLALLRRKPALYLASFNDGMATVAYSVQDGRIVYRVVSGNIGAAAREEIDRALAKLQRKLA